MKTVITSFLMLCACFTCAFAADIVKGSATETENLTPKPAFVITYDGAIELANGSALTKSYLYDNVTFTVNEEAKKFVADYDATNNKITFLTEDDYYLPAKADVAITLPALRYAGEVESAQITGETFNFTIEDYITLEHTASYAENKSLVIKSGNEYRVTSDQEWRQIVVENGAGIKIDAGQTLTATDTVYFLSKRGDVMNMGYLINKGNFDATAVFTKNIEGNQYVTFSLPVAEEKYSDISLSPKPDDDFYFNNYYGDTWSRDLDEGTFTYDGAPMVFNTYNPYFIFRCKGELNDNDSYTFNESSYSESLNLYNQQTKMNNPYPAPVDWRSIYEDERTDANAIFTNTDLNLNDYYVYHPFSGVTTYDGPMEYGYLQPAMSNVGLWNNETCETTFAKKDLTSYSEVVDKYSESKPKYPYIRFYCDDAKNPKGQGHRSVTVAYFIPKNIRETIYQDKMSDYHYDVSLVTEESNESIEFTFPYISLHKENSEIGDLVIGAYSFEDATVDNLGNMSLDIDLRVITGALGPNQIKVGVLGYYLPDGISFSGDLSPMNLEIEKEVGIGKWGDYTYSKDVIGKSCFISLKFTQPKPTNITEEQNNNIAINIVNNNIKVSGLEIGDICNIYNMMGTNIATEKATLSELNFEIAQKGIYFVEILNDSSKVVKKIIVE